MDGTRADALGARSTEYRLRVDVSPAGWTATLERPGEVVVFHAPLELARFLARPGAPAMRPRLH